MQDRKRLEEQIAQYEKIVGFAEDPAIVATMELDAVA